jgi:hypothetical protein
MFALYTAIHTWVNSSLWLWFVSLLLTNFRIVCSELEHNNSHSWNCDVVIPADILACKISEELYGSCFYKCDFKPQFQQFCPVIFNKIDICMIWGTRSSDYEEFYLLGCYLASIFSVKVQALQKINTKQVEAEQTACGKAYDYTRTYRLSGNLQAN